MYLLSCERRQTVLHFKLQLSRAMKPILMIIAAMHK